MPAQSPAQREEFPIYDATTFMARWAFKALFRHTQVEGLHNLEGNQPYILSCTHNNMMIDPGLVMVTLPNRRAHIWAKSTLFEHPVGAFAFNGLGAVSVDRKNKQNSSLFTETIKAMQRGRAILVFPEGTSYTNPDMMEVKDGMSHALIAYERTRRGFMTNGISNDLEKSRDTRAKRKWGEASILPIGIAYTDKKTWRSQVTVTYGDPVKLDDELLKKYDEDPKGVARVVSKVVVERMRAAHVTASSWESINMAHLCWETLTHSWNIPFKHYVAVNNSIIDILDSRTELTSKTDDFSSSIALLQRHYTLMKSKDLKPSQLVFLERPQVLTNETLISTVACWVGLHIIAAPMFLYHSPYHLGTAIINSIEVYTECIQQNRGLVILAGYPVFVLIYAMITSWYFGGSVALFIAVPLGMVSSFIYLRVVDELFEYDDRLAAILKWRFFLTREERTDLYKGHKSVAEEWKLLLPATAEHTKI